MLQAINATPTAVAAAAPLTFTGVRIRTGSTAVLSTDLQDIVLQRAGFYLVHFNADVAPVTAGGVVQIQMTLNGTPVTAAIGTETGTAASEVHNLGFSVIVQVCPLTCGIGTNDVLTFINNGSAATISNMSAVVTKIA